MHHGKTKGQALYHKIIIPLTLYYPIHDSESVGGG